MEKLKKLEKVLSELNISDKELISWVNNCSKNATSLILTELPLVYRQGNELTIEDGLNLRHKHELWGIQLLSGVMVALKCCSVNNVLESTWEKVTKFAEQMHFNGKRGFLPFKNALKGYWGTEEQTKLVATVEVLKENEIETDSYWGYIWCSEQYSPSYAYHFNLNGGYYTWGSKDYTSYNTRIALAFR